MNSFNAEELEPRREVKVEEALVKGREWIQLDRPNESGEKFNIKNEHLGLGLQKPEYLGLHENNGAIRPSHFVGARWLDSTTALIVDSKFSENKVDTVLMFSDVLESEGNISKGLFECYPEEKTIPGQLLQDASLLQIAVFLKQLAQFCQRDLRMGFIPIQENLTGKVKGRVLVSEQVRRNLTRGRADRTVCAFTIISMDTLPNQILRWALHLCLRYLARAGDVVPRVLWNWGRISESALSGVTLTPIHTTDFRGLIYAGFMKRYRHPHALARMIIARLHIDPNGEVKEKGTVPFYLDMNKLFERYVGVKLRTCFKSIESQQQLQTPEGENQFPTIKFIPDCVCRTPNEVWIIDAKYKRYFSESNQNYDQLQKEFKIECEELFSSIHLINADIYQALAYATMWPNQTNENNKRRVNVTVLAVPTTKEIDFEKIIKERTFPRVNLDVFNEYKLCLGILPIPLPKKRV